MKDELNGFNLSKIDDTVIELELVTFKKESENRKLQENDLLETVNISSWAPISFHGSELRIQTEFNFPLLVSKFEHPKKDEIRIKILEPGVFQARIPAVLI